MADLPTLYVCHGDEGGPRMHPCRRVQEAMHTKGIAYEKVIAGHGNPIPFLRKGSREELRAATGNTKLPTLKLPDGTVLTHARAILAWVGKQEPAGTSPQPADMPQQDLADMPQEGSPDTPQQDLADMPQQGSPAETLQHESAGIPQQGPLGTSQEGPAET